MSKIEWTDETWNPTAGCSWASPGCDNCYAFTMTKRLAAMGQAKYQGVAGRGHFNGTLKTWDDELAKPLRWRKPRMVFVNSMSDLFHPNVPFEFIDNVFAVMALAHWHTFQVLTKRPERMSEWSESRTKELNGWRNHPARHMPDAIGWVAGRCGLPCDPDYLNRINPEVGNWPLPNVWLGTSVEDQQRADERIPHLLKCPAAVRFLSCEPLLGPLDLDQWIFDREADLRKLIYGPMACNRDQADAVVAEVLIGWVITGCESGHNRRNYRPEWADAIQGQCAAAGVAFFRKQEIVNGRVSHDPNEWESHRRIREFPKAATAVAK